MKHKGWITIGLLVVSSIAVAQNAQTGTAFTSNAAQFAMQAGAIGGTAQACGQNMSTFNSHVMEAINTLGKTAIERSQAMAAYQKASTEAQAYQNRSHTMNCTEVAQVFNTLPLMRADYKQTVLPQLAQLNNPNAFKNLPPAPTTPPTATNSPTGPSAPATMNINNPTQQAPSTVENRVAVLQTPANNNSSMTGTQR